MLEVLVNFICAFIFAILGFYIVKIIINSDEKLSIKNILVLVLNSIIISLIHNVDYSSFSPIINFVTNTVTYKIVFKINLQDSVLATGIVSLFVLIADIIFVVIQSLLFSLDQIQNNIFLYLISNIVVALIVLSIISLEKTKKELIKYYKILSNKNLYLDVIFIVMLILGASAIIYKVSINYRFNLKFISDYLLMLSMFAIGVIYINNKDGYNKLSDEYDVLLNSVRNFEEWIENEQFARHEYKNQLAVLYDLSQEKAVKKKIQEIINQNLDIDSQTVYALKSLPKGGLKGLMYYKSIVAQSNKINLTIDVSINEKGILSKLNKNELNSLSKILGILYDNAIDASKESRKKIILLEIYELKDRINIVISNTFKKSKMVENQYEKGVSSKGKGHGYGLYFAKKILKDNRWIKEKQEIIDNYYIEVITIYKNTSKK